MRSWQLQEAKAQLSDLVRRCAREGPQEITVRSQPTAVLLSRRDHDRLRRSRNGSFVDFLRQSPLCGLDLPVARSVSPVRDAILSAVCWTRTSSESSPGLSRAESSCVGFRRCPTPRSIAVF